MTKDIGDSAHRPELAAGHSRIKAAEQLWLELPPISPSAPSRLLIFLHGERSSPEQFAPVAIAWQLKFPGATAALLQSSRPGQPGGARNWYSASGPSDGHAAQVAAAVVDVAQRIEALQQSTGVGSRDTVVVGFSQGATVAIDLARRLPGLAGVLVAYAGKLVRPVRNGEQIRATIHLLHGELDSLVPAVHSERAFRHLRAIGADVSLDIVADAGHGIGQSLVTLATTRVLQTIFRGRRPKSREPDHPERETLQ